MNDLRYAFRLLLKSPGFTLIAILTLALGIGANTAIFSVVNAVLLRPLPLTRPDQLVQIFESKKFPAGFLGSSSAANIRDWREQNTTLQGIAVYQYQDFALQDKSSPERILGVTVSANYFRLLGAQPLLGRTFVEGEDEAAGANLVVLSEGLWRAQFGADPAIVGLTIPLDGRAFTVIGVMPASFRFPSERGQLWVPLVVTPAQMAARGDHGLQVVGRLRPGVSLGQAQANMETVALTIGKKYPDEQGDRSISLVPLQEQLTRNSRASLLVLLGSVACVLLIATANIANLLLARAAGRQREIALRLALGASRARLVRQFLVESILLAALGGAAGIIIAIWGIDLLLALLGNQIPGASAVHLDGTVLSFTALLAFGVGIGCGLAPARQMLGRSAADMQTALHGQTARAGANRLRGLLVVAEVALAVVLLSGAGLLLRSFAALQQTDSGLRAPEQVLTARVALPNDRYARADQVIAFYQRALDRIKSLPGVRSAGAINFLPLAQWGMNGNIKLEGHPFPPGQEPLAEFRCVAGNYFGTMGVPLLAGRLTDARDGAKASPSIVVNRALARRFGESESGILGGKILIGSEYAFTIVGVVADVRQSGLDREPQPEIYFPVAQAPGSEGLGGNMLQVATLVVRANATEPSALVTSVRHVIQEIDPSLPLFRVETMQNVIAESVADRRLNGALLGTFAAIALALAALGLYGVISYAVTQRTRELGIRMALGAQRATLFRMVVGDGMKLAAIGLGLGLLAAFGLTRFLASLLYGVGATDPVTFVSVVCLLALVALLANYLPARRATKVNPMEALRAE
jgi:putative ABC transport system permease protein